MRDILAALVDGLAAGQEMLLCQVVETKGSTPQKANAWMLVGHDGSQVGTLGGGCVENEVRLKALRRLGDTGADIHEFLLDHDYAWADGLICGGKMVILAEAFRGAEAHEYFSAYGELLEAGLGLTEAVVLDPDRVGLGRVGSRLLFDTAGQLRASLAVEPGSRSPVEPELLVDRPRPRVRGGLAWMPSLPRVRLVVVGAGHVGQAVAELAARADFDVWVVDDRAQYANSARFPDAERIVVGPIDEVLTGLEVTPHTFALVVTRGHGHDQEALFHLAPTAASYVGLIGSRRKIRLILDGLAQQGIAPEALARVTAPVGIDIGSQTVPEIAISIVAQLISRRNRGPDSVPTIGRAAADPADAEPARA